MSFVFQLIFINSIGFFYQYILFLLRYYDLKLNYWNFSHLAKIDRNWVKINVNQFLAEWKILEFSLVNIWCFSQTSWFLFCKTFNLHLRYQYINSIQTTNFPTTCLKFCFGNWYSQFFIENFCKSWIFFIIFVLFLLNRFFSYQKKLYKKIILVHSILLGTIQTNLSYILIQGCIKFIKVIEICIWIHFKYYLNN